MIKLFGLLWRRSINLLSSETEEKILARRDTDIVFSISDAQAIL
jgi:hypothetical protein